jgi:hypothetical protein
MRFDSRPATDVLMSCQNMTSGRKVWLVIVSCVKIVNLPSTMISDMAVPLKNEIIFKRSYLKSLLITTVEHDFSSMVEKSLGGPDYWFCRFERTSRDPRGGFQLLALIAGATYSVQKPMSMKWRCCCIFKTPSSAPSLILDRLYRYCANLPIFAIS